MNLVNISQRMGPPKIITEDVPPQERFISNDIQVSQDNFDDDQQYFKKTNYAESAMIFTSRNDFTRSSEHDITRGSEYDLNRPSI